MTLATTACVLLILLFELLISRICVGFDVCHNLIQVEHDLDKDKKVTACHYEILKLDPSVGVMIREAVTTPVNQTLCHELRTADTCRPDGTLVTCHHVPEWERHPDGTFVPPLGCTFSQNLQCQLETICTAEVETPETKPVTKVSDNTMTTTESPRRRFVMTDGIRLKEETTTSVNRETTAEKAEITQHILIHVPRFATESPRSGASVIRVDSLFNILAVFICIVVLNMVCLKLD